MILQLLGARTVPQFLSRHWQKRPLLVRNALPGFKDVVQAPELFRLASREAVESRMVRRSGRRWLLEHGPFPASRLRAMPSANWTLLVQGLNLHHPAADRLLRRFNFIPYARLDDLMLSYAAPGGGVGPHCDSYDVFLLQGRGRRLWRIGRPGSAKLVEGSDLRLLQDFRAHEEYLLESGDMLYLPPGWGHDGVALDECTTYSIGFRAPARQELAAEYLLRQSERIALPGLYRDPDLRPQSRPAAIPAAMVDKTAALLPRRRPSRREVLSFLGEYLSEPKARIVFRRPARALSTARFGAAAQRRGIRLDAASLMLHAGSQVFINGESLAPGSPRAALAALKRLADDRSLPPRHCARTLWPMLHEWYKAGWLHLGELREKGRPT
jgi:50S ribosomal protein L16 3-hydroxylase